MTPTEKGAFCQKCATQVYDFTNKSAEEIKQTLRSLIGQPVCGRITAAQENALNAEFEAWSFHSKHKFQSALVFSLIVVFGLSLFSCSNEQDRKKIEHIQTSAVKAMTQQDLPKDTGIPVIEPAPIVLEAPMPEVYEIVEVEKTINLEDVDIAADRWGDYYGYGGAMVMTDRYVDFLQAEVTPVVEELDENGVPYPTVFSSLAFPNPATTETTLELKAPMKGQFEIVLYDMNGRFLQTVHSGEINRGTFRKQIDLFDLLPGMYIIAIVSKDYKETIKVSKI